MFGSLDISTSGMVAQRVRLEVATSNLANANTMLDPQGRVNPYRRRIVGFAEGDPGATTEAGRALGVHVSGIDLDDRPFTPRWDPDNPYAQRTGRLKGYVLEPNINTVAEMVNAVEAARAYEANVTAAEATKSMVSQALRLLA